jgi:predicted Fe-Mo cluster-binding NifX family protein
MKIAVTSQGPTPDSVIDAHFGRAPLIMVYDDQTDMWECLNNAHNSSYVEGAGIQSAAHVHSAGCQVLLCGHCGPKAFQALKKAGVTIYTIAGGTVGTAVDSFKRAELPRMESADVAGHP